MKGVRFFRPSSIAHPWRESLAVFAILAWIAVGESWLMQGPLLWLLRLFGPTQWYSTGLSS